MDFSALRRIWDGRDAWFEPVPDEWYDFVRRAGVVMAPWLGVELPGLVPLCIRDARTSGAVRHRGGAGYTLLLNATRSNPSMLRYGLAREAYHWIGYDRRHLRELLWVDELVGFAVAISALRTLGYDTVANDVEHVMIHANCKLAVAEFPRIRRRRWPACLNPVNGLHAGAAVLALRLAGVVGMDQVVAIGRARSWEEWLEPMPPATQDIVRRMLRLDAAG